MNTDDRRMVRLRRTRRGPVRRAALVGGVVGLVAAPMAVFATSAQALPPSSVWIEAGVLRVLSPAGTVNAVTLSAPAAGTLRVVDTVNNVAAVFPCVAVTAHQVDCPSVGVNGFAIDTNDLNDRIVNLTALPGRILAGAGNDFVSDGLGSQTIVLGPGNDLDVQGPGKDLVIGGLGTDTVSYASRVANVAIRFDNIANDGQAGEGDQLLELENGVGGAGNDLLIGNALPNRLDGLGGNDGVFGVDGPDTLFGGLGNDTVSGGNGNDFVDGGLGTDQMFGGLGVDTVSYTARAAAVAVRLDNLANDGQAGEADNAHSDLENILGGAGNDLLVGSASPNFISGNAGNDSMFGLGGNDRLIGGVGIDLANGGAGVDACVAETEFLCEI